MPQLLTLPYAVPLSASGAILPGSKLSFYQTGTSTPQSVYTNISLSVAHSQPVVADGAGRFAKIYLDPGLPDYRILLTDSAGGAQPGFPIDDVPSGPEGIAAKAFKLTATDRSSTTSIADDPDLLFALQADATYRIDVSLLFVGVTTGTQGFQWAIGYTGSVALIGSAIGIQSLNSVGTVRTPFTPTSANSLGTMATASNDGLVYSFVLKTTTAGNLSVQWAQAVSSANATRMVAGSYILATRLG